MVGCEVKNVIFLVSDLETCFSGGVKGGNRHFCFCFLVVWASLEVRGEGLQTLSDPTGP